MADQKSNEQRAAEVRALIDEEMPGLPQVEIRDAPGLRGKGNFRVEKYQILHDGKMVGRFVLQSNLAEKTADFGGISIDPEEQGKGYAAATYREMIARSMATGNSFQTHPYSQTPGTVAIWSHLEHAGVAEPVESFTGPDNAGKSIGHYVVLAAGASL